MKEYWNKRYSSPDYVYGKNPNDFLKTELQRISEPGKILFLGEGEGRNAVYAAKLGWEVDAIDFSEAAEKKTKYLAEEENVQINFFVQNIADFHFEPDHYNVAVIIFFHLSEDLRTQVHESVIESLKKNGRVILQVFDKDQFSRNSGGPKDIERLYSLEDVFTDFHTLKIDKFSKDIIILDEGSFHKGEAAVISYVGIKEY